MEKGDDQDDNFQRSQDKLMVPAMDKSNRVRKRSLFGREEQINSFVAEKKEDKKNKGQIYDIYNNNSKESISDSQSSFELDEQSAQAKQMQEKQTIEKVLARLGLNNNASKPQNWQLEFVFTNFIENTIGTVDVEENTQNYENLHGNMYNDQLKKITRKGSIIVSELNGLEKILKMNSYGFQGLYKYIRFIMKKISIICRTIAEHAIFQALVMIVIILNSIKMAFDDPLNSSSNSGIDNAFTAFYTVQMGIKILAFGFLFNKNAYLRDLWNILDFVIVSTSLLPLFINLNFSVKALRAIRVLRPLKTITRIRALKMIIRTLFLSFSLVMDSLYILLFVMVIFSIAGTQLFSGVLQNNCMNLNTGELTGILCITGSTCSDGYVCAKGIQSPNISIYNFDTFIWAMLSVFQTLTMQGWSAIMIDLQLAYSPYSLFYSIAIVFFCEYILLNMTMAILKYKYSQVKGDDIEQQVEEINQYEPDFLKKLKIYQKMSKLAQQPPLTRYLSDSKCFVGSRQFYDDSKEVKNYHVYDLTVQRLQRLKTTTKRSTNFKNYQGKLDIEELKALGKTYEQKWDAKTLQFESNNPNENRARNDKLNEGSQAAIKQMPESQQEDQLTDSQQGSQYDDEDDDDDDDDSSDSNSDDELAKRSALVRKGTNKFQIRLPTDSKSQKKNRSATISNKLLPEVPMMKKVASENQEVRQLDNMLRLIAQDPESSLKNNNYSINLPEVDLEQIEVQKLYQRFNDLGEYRIKRVQKENHLNNMQIRRQKPKNIPQTIKKKQNIIKETIEEAELDLKELQLVNQLSKKQLKCRIKQSNILEEQKTQNSYDITRVISSLKLKEVQKKEEEIIKNTNTLDFKVIYKLTDTKTKQKEEKEKQKQKDKLKLPKKKNENIFRRNLNNEIKGLKIPQILKVGHVVKPQSLTSKSIKSGDANNTYLRLLQNHQMQQKIQLLEDRVMNIFFKRDNHRQQLIQKKDEEEQKLSLVEQYNKTKQEDIFQNQGRILLETPFQSIYDSMQDLISKINMRNEEYEIFMRGFFGVINVIRKKTLLFVTRPLYDNFMITCVIGNTIILSMNGFVNTDAHPFTDINTTFTFIFAVDLVLKLFAYGVSFFSDIMNLFDSFVVCISIVELTFGSGGTNLSALRAVRILRAFRVLRITRLVRTLSFMRKVMSVVSSIITQFIYIFLLLALFIFIYTLLGMQIFGGQFISPNITGIRQNYDTFFNSFFSVFQVLTVQNWNDIETAVLSSKVGQWSVVFLISWIFIGNWILLNLLQAILLDGFDQDSDILNKPEQPINLQFQEEFYEQMDENFSQSASSQSVSISSGFSSFKGKNTDASLFIFYPDSMIRSIAISIAGSKIFQYILVVVIALSSLKLVVDTYFTPESDYEQIASILDIVFNGVFIFQAVVKMIAQGFILGDQAYLKSNWSKLDFFIVSVAVIDMSMNLGLSILKIFRTLRPLRIISRNPDMKVMIESLGESILGIFNVLIIVMFVFLIFGILGINLLGGKLNYCNASSQLNHAQYGPYGINQTTCVSQGGVWTTQLVNFDNIASSFLSLYVFSTRQNWPFYAFSFMDSSSDGPVKDNSQIVFMIYCIVIIFVISYFFMDLLVGVLFMNYHAAAQRIMPRKLSDKQINWQNLQKIIIEEDPCFDIYLKPSNKFKGFFYMIVHQKWFEHMMTACIIGNILVMMINENDQPYIKTFVLVEMNFAFSIVFILEAIMKIFAYGKAYFLSGWNIFDFFVVLASILDIVLNYSGMKSQGSSVIQILPQIARIFRVMRITKLLRMFKRFEGLQKLIETFIFSLPAVGKGLSLVVLFFFIFADLATFLFSKITGDFAGAFDDFKNFAHFHNSFQTLFIMTTGQNWYFYMFETMEDGYVTCAQGGDSACTQPYYLIFWLIFVFLSQKVFMQLFVLIVMDQFEANYINENNPLGIFALLEDDFREKWIQMTTKYRSQKIQTKRLLDFLLTLKQPLGLGKNELMIKYQEELRQNQKITQEEVKHSLSELDVKLKKNGAKIINKIPIIKNRMYLGYHETFYHFAKISIAGQAIESTTEDQKAILDQLHKDSQQALEKLKPEGNLYYYQEGNQNLITNQTLNPVQLILFCQMIVKSWHNYSLKYHHNEQKQNKKKKNEDNSLYNSLNNSCASDIEQAQLERIQNNKKAMQKKASMSRRSSQQLSKEARMIPNVQDHYRSDRKKFKTKMHRRKDSLRKSSIDQSSNPRSSRFSIRPNVLQIQE